MAAVNHPGEGAELYDAVQAIGSDLCPKLGVSIPVGKDSTSMKASWKESSGEAKSVTAPVSVVISAFSLVDDVRRTWTPQLRRVEEVGESVLLFVDLAQGRKAMGKAICSFLRVLSFAFANTRYYRRLCPRTGPWPAWKRIPRRPGYGADQ